ncbi:zinc finger MYM-type protein 1-like, partial [Aphis craccivora]
MGRHRDIGRTFSSGHQNRLKKQKLNNFLKTQRGAMDKFNIVTSSPPIDVNVHKNDKVTNTIAKSNATSSCSPLFLPNASNFNVEPSTSKIDKSQVDKSVMLPLLPVKNTLNCDEIKNSCSDDNKCMYLPEDLRDPSRWPEIMTSNIKQAILEIGPIRITNINFPVKSHNNNRKFSEKYYYRIMPNGEKVDRNWLVYSLSADCVYCFPCKLFNHESNSKSNIVNIGFDDWKHLLETLKSHEVSKCHYQCITKWYELKNRTSLSNKIDKLQLQIFEKQKQHWRAVLKRIISAISFLAKHSDAFRGSSDVIYTKNNGKFLGIIEMLAKFDPIIIDHVNRIKNNETHVHYLGPQIQDEIINMLALKTKEIILTKIQQSKYYAVIMDSTPDISHKEQVSIVIRTVIMDSDEEPSIKEYFLNFIEVKSTTGLNLSSVLIKELSENGLQLSNCRGQAYDNGANMVGQYKGVQARILKNNPRAFFTPCAAHNLNLVLQNSAKVSTRAVTFFGFVERIYNFFTASTQRWNVLKTHCDLYSVKKWSETRWESRLSSIKALRFQFKQIINALDDIIDITDESIAKSEAQSLYNEVESFEFIISLIIWYDILSEVNIVSKQLQDPKMQIGISVSMLKGLITFLEKYREYGFQKAENLAKELAVSIDIEPVFKIKRHRKKKRNFDYECSDAISVDSKEIFRTEFFISVLDSTIVSIRNRFDQLQTYNNNF